jgi:phage terminase large subunit-like protein
MPELTLHHRLRRQHASVFRSPKRFKIVVAGRRWGKTWLAVWWLVVSAFSGPDRICYYIAPNYRQAKRIAWEVLKQFVPITARRRTNEQELCIQLRNGSIIQLHGADNPDSLRGVGLDSVVLDEYAFMRSDTWPMVVRPMLSDRKGCAMFISTRPG